MLFFYNIIGDYMKIYIDLVLILNFCFDLLLLLTVSIVLKRHVKFYKLLIGSFFGSLSILFLFIKINSLELFLLKFIISILMTVMTFSELLTIVDMRLLKTM